MTIQEHVELVISVSGGAQISRPGFGVPAGLSVNAGWVERSRSYRTLVEAAADWDTDSPEYLFLSTVFGQSPRPPLAKILRAVGQPTQRYTLNVVNVQNDHTYQIYVEGEGVEPTTVEFTSSGAATDGEIAAGLVAALNLVTGKNFTAAGATSPFTVTGDAPGNWFSLQILNFNDLDIVQDHAEPATSLADDLAAIITEDPDWYGLHTFYNSTDYVAVAAAAANSHKRLYIGESCDSTALVTPEASGTDVLDDLDENNYSYVGPVYHWAPHEMLGAAIMGRCLPLDPGTETWAFKQLQGITVPPLNSTMRGHLNDRQASYMKSGGGVDYFFEGKVADSTVVYIDMRRLLDWIQSEVEAGVFGSLVGAERKIPYTNAGVAQIEARVLGALLKGVRRNAIARDPEPIVTAPLVEDVDPQDKAARVLPDVEFDAVATGAIHKVKIAGTVTQ